MTDGLFGYPEYQDSGVEWLGEIPAHWRLEPVFAEYREKQVKNTGLIEKNVLSLSYGRIIVKPPEKLHGLVPASFETYQIIDPGDIIIRTTDLQNDRTSLRIGLSNYRGIITSAYMCLQVWNELSAEYGYHILNTYDLTKAIYGYGSGLRQNLSFSDIKRMPIPVPPPDEQDAIVRFLDEAERRIRRYIRAKQKLIKLLNEQKQAIIQQAVTRGLDPDVPMKDSGVEWLGEIPEHWEVSPLKYIVPGLTVGIVIQPARLYTPHGIPCLRSLNISSGHIRSDNLVYISPEANEANQKSKIYEGDIVVVRTGQAGMAVVVPIEFNGANCIDLLIIRKSSRILSEYLRTYLNSYGAKSNIVYNSVGAIQAHYNTSTLANLIVPLPSPDEQQLILIELGLQLKPIAETIENVSEEIDVIREYRTRLIADVVTGKVDVRGVAFEMPETFDESDLTDADFNDTDELDESDMDEALEEGADAD